MNAYRILVVDDDPLFTAGARALLTHAGYEVRTIANADNPLLDAEIIAADLILLELALGDGAGFSILSHVRGNPLTTNKPLLALTAHEPMRCRLRSLSLGADDFLAKPPNSQELQLRIAALLRRARPEQNPEMSQVMVEYGGAHSFVSADSIRFVEAARNYCYLHTDHGRKLSSANIGNLEQMLGEGFIRTHRSYLVNLRHVVGGRWLSRSAYVLDVNGAGDLAVPVSRAYRERVRNALRCEESPAMSTTA